jgi:hypothetical protein
MKNLENYCEELKLAVDFINGADIAEGMRKVIRRALMSELDQKSGELEQEIRYERQGRPFTDAELLILRDYLKDKIARTCEEEHNILNILSIKLRRKNDSVKRKAISEGFQSAVDHWMNRHTL